MTGTTTMRIGTLVFAAAVATACGGDPGTSAQTDTTADTRTSTSPPASIAPTTTVVQSSTTSVEAVTTTVGTTDATEAVPLDSVVGGTIRGEGWLVEPGLYTTSLGDRELLLSITEPVVYFGYQGVVFGPDTNSPNQDLFVLNEFVGVIPPERVGEHADHDPIVPPYTEPVPDDLGSWLSSVSQLVSSDRQELTTPNIEGAYWDVRVDGEGDTFHCGFGSCIGSLVQEVAGVFVLFKDSSFRLWQLDGEADGMYGFLQSDDDSFEEVTALADMILDGLTVSTSD